MAVKPDFRPLLAPGFHRFDLDGICRLCCFPDNLRRSHLFLHLEQLVQDLLLREIRCELWIDGSFLTEKPEPSDIDVIVKFDYDVTLNFTSEQQEFVAKLEEGSYNERIDSFTFTQIPRGHQEFDEGEIDRTGWAKLLNVEHGGYWLKGVAVIRLGETNVGLLFYP